MDRWVLGIRDSHPLMLKLKCVSCDLRFRTLGSFHIILWNLVVVIFCLLLLLNPIKHPYCIIHIHNKCGHHTHTQWSSLLSLPCPIPPPCCCLFSCHDGWSLSLSAYVFGHLFVSFIPFLSKGVFGLQSMLQTWDTVQSCSQNTITGLKKIRKDMSIHKPTVNRMAWLLWRVCKHTFFCGWCFVC